MRAPSCHLQQAKAENDIVIQEVRKSIYMNRLKEEKLAADKAAQERGMEKERITTENAAKEKRLEKEQVAAEEKPIAAEENLLEQEQTLDERK